MRRSHNPSLTHDPTRKKMVPPSQRSDNHHIYVEEHFSYLRFLAWSRSSVSILFSKIFLRWAQTVEHGRTISAPIFCIHLKDISNTSKNCRALTDIILHLLEGYFWVQHKLQSADRQYLRQYSAFTWKIFLRPAKTAERGRTISAPILCIYLKGISKTSTNSRARTNKTITMEAWPGWPVISHHRPQAAVEKCHHRRHRHRHCHRHDHHHHHHQAGL